MHNREVDSLVEVSFVIKDNLCIHNMSNMDGLYILSICISSFDTIAVSKLHSLGAILLIKTNIDEFRMGSSTEGSAYQIMVNP